MSTDSDTTTTAAAATATTERRRRAPTNIDALRFATPLLNAAGARCGSEAAMRALDRCGAVGAVVSKSCTEAPRTGNVQPRAKWYAYDAARRASVNANGLANPGVDHYLEAWQRGGWRSVFCLSVAFTGAGTAADAAAVLRIVARADAAGVPMIELNASCPNVQHADDADAELEQLLAALADARKVSAAAEEAAGRAPPHRAVLGLKLPLLLSRHALDATVARVRRHAALVRFVTAGNTLPGGLVRGALTVNNGLGGVGGAPCKPIALANARALAAALAPLDVAVIGCGGVFDASDVDDYLAVGCRLVASATALIENGPELFARL